MMKKKQLSVIDKSFTYFEQRGKKWVEIPLLTACSDYEIYMVPNIRKNVPALPC